MTKEEFKIGIENNDILCILAQALCDKEAIFHTTNLLHARDYIRDKYLEKARQYINFLNEFNLKIIYEKNI